MTTDALKAFFALLETDDDDFASLVRRFGIDPAIDLQNCDLRDVDFGSLTADTLDLTGSDIDGANLSKVNCKRVIGVEPAIHVSPKRAAFDDVLLAISRYQNSDWVLHQIAAASAANPAMTFYDSAAEQDLLTKRICTHYGDASHIREGMNMHALGMKLLWFYSKSTKGVFRLNPAGLDKMFFQTLYSTNKSADIGLYPYRSNQASVERISSAVVHSTDYKQMRRAFVRGLRNEISEKVEGGVVRFPGSIVIFSGFAPISKRLYQEMREAIPGKMRLIFLCPSNLEPHYLAEKGLPWRRVAVPAYSIGEPLTVEEDVRRIIKRIEVASGGRITISDGIRQWMEEFVGKPLATLKYNVVTELSTSFPLSALRGGRSGTEPI